MDVLECNTHRKSYNPILLTSSSQIIGHEGKRLRTPNSSPPSQIEPEVSVLTTAVYRVSISITEIKSPIFPIRLNFHPCR